MKNIFIVCLMLMSGFVFGAAKETQGLLQDGFYINGIEGKLTGPDTLGIYKFIADTDISDGKSAVKAGIALEMLPSSGLEKMLDNYRPGEPYGFKLWARVTAYKEKNYLFVVRFLPFKQLDKEKQRTTITINDPNDTLRIPDSILVKLSGNREILPIQVRPGLEVKEDFVLTDRTGRIENQDNGRFAFVFDALGRNVEKQKLNLLPCRALERRLSEQKNENASTRIKVSGIITKYKNNSYLLLQQTGRVYNNGNFSG